MRLATLWWILRSPLDRGTAPRTLKNPPSPRPAAPPLTWNSEFVLLTRSMRSGLGLRGWWGTACLQRQEMKLLVIMETVQLSVETKMVDLQKFLILRSCGHNRPILLNLFFRKGQSSTRIASDWKMSVISMNLSPSPPPHAPPGRGASCPARPWSTHTLLAFLPPRQLCPLPPQSAACPASDYPVSRHSCRNLSLRVLHKFLGCLYLSRRSVSLRDCHRYIDLWFLRQCAHLPPALALVPVSVPASVLPTRRHTCLQLHQSALHLL